MKLALIRHGITEWNLEKRVQGRIDQPLSLAGRSQLQQYQLPSQLLDYQWYCSPLRRARESAELLGLRDYRIEPDLIEMSWGDWEGEILKPLRKKLGDEMRLNEARGVDFCPPGGESPRQVQQRLGQWMERLVTDNRNAGAIVHKGVIRCIYALAFDWDMRGESPVEFAWDAVHHFELTPAGYPARYYHSQPMQ